LHYYFFKREASAYVTQTEDVARRVRKSLQTENVFTVTNTYSNFYTSHKTYANRLPTRKPGEIRLLTISSYYPHKNLDIIPKIVVNLRHRGMTNIRFV